VADRSRDSAKAKAVGGAIGNCVHVAGVVNFLRLAEMEGYEPVFLGPATSVDEFVQAVQENDPGIVGVSFRLTPSVAATLVEQLKGRLEEEGLVEGRRFLFGGTPPVCQAVQGIGLFEACFGGDETPEEILASIRGDHAPKTEQEWGSTQLERAQRLKPYPMIRHHFGLPSLDETIEGIARIAEAKVCDVISIGPDQNAQESFFRPKEMNPDLDGAGGVPLRAIEDLQRIYQASRRGNYPLLRIYSGTRDLIKWAEVSVEYLHNAWGAIPLTWYSTLDGRSPRSVPDAIRENQEAMAWYGARDIPVECNEAHHWSMRDAPDVVAVVMAYLGAYNCKALGVRHYIAQYMLNSPPVTTGAMDTAKMLAKIDLIESLHDESSKGGRFVSMRQVRPGLLSFSPDLDVAKGQLSAAVVLGLGLHPHIIHVVGFSEGDHAATARDVIESCKIAQGAIRNCLFGMPEFSFDADVARRKDELVSEAKVLIEGIRRLGHDCKGDPLTDADNLARAIRTGLVDAPHLIGNPEAHGRTVTRAINGAIYAVDADTKLPIPEEQRVRSLLPARTG
jgi:methylmalonyl-CoA mutase cobalamin-binding subunit